MSDRTVQLMMYACGAIFVVGACIIIFLVIRGIWRAIKRFTFELIDHANGTSSSASKKNYTREARSACEKATPKKDKNATPPWEE